MRWLAGASAAALVVALAVMFLRSTCARTAWRQPATIRVRSKVCRSLAVTDPPVVAVGVALLALVGVFYKEVSGFGITLKRDVSDAKDAAETAREQASAARDAVTNLQSLLTVQMSNIQADLSQSVTATQRQLSALRSNQSMVFNPTFNLPGTQTELPRETETAVDPAAQPTESEALKRIRAQAAYRETGLRQAHEATRALHDRGVRVAIVGASPGIAVMGFPAFRGHISQPYVTIGAEVEGATFVGAVELGHILAMEPEAQIYPVVVTDRHGGGDVRGIRDGLVAALRWNPAVLLMGVGGFPGDTDVEQLLRRATASGFVVVGAGNSAREGPEWPGSLPNVTSVAALTKTGQLAPNSNHGTGVDLAAPGDDVLSLVGIGT